MLGLLFNAVVIMLIVMTLTWLIQLKTRNATIIDPIWSFSVGGLALFYFQFSADYRAMAWMALAIALVWSLRLGMSLTWRVFNEKEEDKRYALIRREWQPQLQSKMLGMFWFQGLIDVALSLPFLVIFLGEPVYWTVWHTTGVLICLMALVGEETADEQLRQFKRKGGDGVCTQGLWAYSRHPNYFFEWLFWIGVAVFALPSRHGWLAFFCPVMMYVFLNHVTGIPLLEQLAVESRGEAYKQYQRTTSRFFPWKRNAQ